MIITTPMRLITRPTTQVALITAIVKLTTSQQDAVDIVAEGAIILPRAFRSPKRYGKWDGERLVLPQTPPGALPA